MYSSINEQLYHKNNLLKSYQEQTKQLKALINKQQTYQYMKLPKSGSMVNAMNKLQAQNGRLKQKLNEYIEMNTGLVHRAEKQVMFNKKLERENQLLKLKVSQFSRKIQGEDTNRLARNLIMGTITNLNMVGGGSNNSGNSNNDQLQQNSNNNQQQQYSTESVGLTKKDSSPLNPQLLKQQQQQQTLNFITSLLSKSPNQPSNTFSLPPATNDLVLRSFQIQKTQTQLQNQVHFLKQQLAKTQQQLKQSQHQLKLLKLKISEYEENNQLKQVIMKKNDKLAGEFTQVAFIKEILQKQLTEKNQLIQEKDQIMTKKQLQIIERQNQNQRQKQAMSLQIQQLRASLTQQIFLLATQNQSLKDHFKQSISLSKSKDNNSRLGGSHKRIQSGSKQLGNSQLSIKDHHNQRSIKSIKSRDNYRQSRVSERSHNRDNNNNQMPPSPKSHKSHMSYKSHKSQRSISLMNEHSQMIGQKLVFQRPEKKVQSINSLINLQQQQQQYQYEQQQTPRLRVADEERIRQNQLQQIDYRQQQEEQKVSKPAIKQTNISYSLDEVQYNNGDNSRIQLSKNPHENSNVEFRNSLLPRRGSSSLQLQSIQQEEDQGFWTTLIKKIL